MVKSSRGITLPFPDLEESEQLDLLWRVLSYDPETGDFHWLVHSGSRGAKGTKAGTLGSDGHIYIKLGRRFAAHRLAWLYMYKHWPKDQIDHINGIGNDNKLSNLREATHAQNMRNNLGWETKRNGSLKGAYLNKKSNYWYSMIMVEGKNIYLGKFSTEEEAHETYVAASRKYHGEFSNTGRLQ